MKLIFILAHTMAPKRKCIFNDKLQEEFPFIKKTVTESDVRCEKCMANFNIANSGKAAIKQHIETSKHKEADLRASCKQIKSFFKSEMFLDREKSLALKEASWSYHLVQHNHSFRSNDCTSKLIKKCFDEQYSCARTKTEAIIFNVFSPYSVKLLKTDLYKINYVTIYSDCSNHGNVKLCSVFIRYFLPNEGIKVKILSINNYQVKL